MSENTTNPFAFTKEFLKSLQNEIGGNVTVNAYYSPRAEFGMILSLHENSALMNENPVEVEFGEADFEGDGQETIEQIRTHMINHIDSKMKEVQARSAEKKQRIKEETAKKLEENDNS